MLVVGIMLLIFTIVLLICIRRVESNKNSDLVLTSVIIGATLLTSFLGGMICLSELLTHLLVQ